tara:strand:- start:2276 stop:2401 length:126 start_codon:yes stop_codon:yes gene_type:complete
MLNEFSQHSSWGFLLFEELQAKIKSEKNPSNFMLNFTKFND